MTIAEKLPRSVLGLCWTLAALHWRTKAAGATHAGLKRLLGTDSEATLRRLIHDARTHRVVSVKYADSKHGRRPVVRLKASTLKQLEGLWLGKAS